MTQTNAKPEVTLDIDALSYGPYGIGRLEGKAVMVPGTAPGDRIVPRVIESRARYDIAELLRLVHPSPERQIPPCPYVGSCGGCSWQHLRYGAQLKGKEKSVADALRRIGKFDHFELRPIIASPLEYGYRRRVRLQCGEQKRLGFFAASSPRLIDVASCHIADAIIERQFAALQQWVARLAAPVEYVEIVAGDDPEELVIAAGIAGDLTERDEAICRDLLDEQAPVSGIVVKRGERRRTWGRTVISVRPEEGVCLKVEADVFTQVNGAANRLLVHEALAAGDFAAADRVAELYAGAGNFTLSIAKRAGAVVAIEGSRASVESARSSAEINHVRNIRWITADVTAAVKRLRRGGERFSKIVLDPPRSGAAAIQGDLAALGAEKIVYVSCDPATLARDLSALAKNGYKLIMAQPVDLFPQTFHVETVALMAR